MVAMRPLPVLPASSGCRCCCCCWRPACVRCLPVLAAAAAAASAARCALASRGAAALATKAARPSCCRCRSRWMPAMLQSTRSSWRAAASWRQASSACRSGAWTCQRNQKCASTPAVASAAARQAASADRSSRRWRCWRAASYSQCRAARQAAGGSSWQQRARARHLAGRSAA